MVEAKQGFFITLEGGEGGGKSTQATLLADCLRQNLGVEVLRTREPGGSIGAESIRHLLVEGKTDRWDGKTETLLHTAARWDHLQKTIYPALSRGAWVICDRFIDSTVAYQGYGHGLDMDFIQKISQLVIGSFVPDLTFILDLPVAEGLHRTRLRSGNLQDQKDNTHGIGQENRYEQMGEAFHERLRQGFLTIAHDNPHRCILLDASVSIDLLAQQIWENLKKRLL